MEITQHDKMAVSSPSERLKTAVGMLYEYVLQEKSREHEGGGADEAKQVPNDEDDELSSVGNTSPQDPRTCDRAIKLDGEVVTNEPC